MVQPIDSARLSLMAMSPAFLHAALAHDRAAAYREIALDLPSGWPDRITPVLEMRLKQLEDDPTLQPWLMRAITMRGGGTMVGHIGFHTAPDPAYLRELAPGGVELGFTIFPPFRRLGLAAEAALSLMHWAAETQAQRKFVLSISPRNTASLALAAKLGFHRVGSLLDEVDGVEDVFSKVVA